jgi:hypothetical protein
MRQATAVILLSEEEKVTLQDWSRRGKSEHRMVERARIILLAGEGRTNEQISKSLTDRKEPEDSDRSLIQMAPAFWGETIKGFERCRAFRQTGQV